MIKTFLLAALLAAGAGVVMADGTTEQFNDGWYAYQEREYDKALRLWRPLADAGDVASQYYIGELYRDGLEDPAAAFGWFEKAAQQGYVKGMNSVARAYLYGDGIEADDAAAFRWFHRSAIDENSSVGQALLAWMYENGRGTSPDIDKALSFYRLAAKQDHVWAQNALGRIYGEGTAVKLDRPRSCYWYDMAAELGDGFAKYQVGYCFAQGWGREADQALAIDYFTQAIDRDMAQAVEPLAWYADNGYTDAQHTLAVLYSEGRLVDQDERRAFSLAQEAADAGHIDSLTLLGSFYFTGKGISRDEGKAEEALLQAALANNAGARSWLAQLYAARGNTNLEDVKKAYVWAGLAVTSDLDGNEPELAAIEFFMGMFEEDSLEMFTIQMDAEATLGEAPSADAERLFKTWSDLFAQELPDVTLAHLRSLTPP
ncbi:MAG: SEL1-like repeat protein [Gammaproteobacteria bacterium]|nr:SEL1-like repeat protein [Gammaproteobacteria bacterium]